MRLTEGDVVKTPRGEVGTVMGYNLLGDNLAGIKLSDGLYQTWHENSLVKLSDYRVGEVVWIRARVEKIDPTDPVRPIRVDYNFGNPDETPLLYWALAPNIKKLEGANR